MASLTIIAEVSAVHILPPVTAGAFGARVARIAGAVVAGRAYQPFMPAGQCKIGPRIMIESPALPVGCVVARLAICRRAQRTAMMIVIVARCARHSFCREALVGMAIDALHIPVLAKQREARQRMVEPDAAGPTARVVAARAILAQFARMLIVLRVAGATLGGKLHHIGGLNVAGFAFGLGVLPG